MPGVMSQLFNGNIFVVCMTGFIFSCHLIYASLCFSSPVSSLVFGTNALFTKPAQSVAPMLIVAILSSYGYEVSRI